MPRALQPSGPFAVQLSSRATSPSLPRLATAASQAALPLRLPFSARAADCLSRALGLLNGCQPFLNALNANGGQLSKFTIFQLLKLAVVNKTADVT